MSLYIAILIICSKTLVHNMVVIVGLNFDLILVSNH